MKIAIGCDHAGYELKELLMGQLSRKGHKVLDHGTHSNESVDYPDFVHPVARDVTDRKARFGILICGSANGVAMTANKHKKIRAAIAWNNKLASLARQHNNANIICIPARFITVQMAGMIVRTFLKTEFEGGRHQRRVKKISKC